MRIIVAVDDCDLHLNKRHSNVYSAGSGRGDRHKSG